MKPKKTPQKNRQRDLFRAALSNIIDPNHGLFKLAKVVKWDRLDETFGSTYCQDNGRPGVSTRLMVALHYLKYTHNLSDEDVVATWVENPYWQYFSGVKWFEHEFPINPSSMSRWRKRIGEAGAEELLTIKAGLKLKAVKSFQLKRYEFGCKVSVAAMSKGGWFVGAKAYHGNPYDGHTLKQALRQVKHVVREPEHVFVDMGYRGHNYKGDTEVHVDKRRRGRTAKSLWRWMKRRAAIEPGIGHLKREHRMDRSRLKGVEGDRINAIMSAAGMNFWKLLKWAADFLRQISVWLLFYQRTSICQIPGKI